MGRLYEVDCTLCGFQSQATEGGSHADFDTYSASPALCRNCNSLVSINSQESRSLCPKCKSDNYLLYGPKTVLKGSATLSRSALMHQAKELERNYEASRPRRRAENEAYLREAIQMSRIIVEIVALMQGRHPIRRRRGAKVEQRISWEPLLPKIFSKIDDELDDTLYSAWVTGRLPAERFKHHLLPSIRRDLRTEIGFKLLEIGIDVTHEEDEESQPDWASGRSIDELKLDRSEYRQASMGDDEVAETIGKGTEGSYWKSQRLKDADEWVDRVLAIEPDWYKGLHLCPRCNEYGLKFKPTIMFD